VRLEPAHNLAVCRAVVCALVLGSSELWEAQKWLRDGQLLRAPPASLAWALPALDALTPTTLTALQGVAALCTLLGLVGFRARVSLGLATLCALVLFALPHFSGGPRHSMHLVWFLAVLALAPSGAALRWPWLNDEQRPAPGRALAVTLSLWALRALLAVSYFFPGWWKLREAGLAWALSDNLQHQLYWKWCQFGQTPSPRIDQYPALLEAGALGVMLFELAFPLLIVLGLRGRIAAAVLGLAFHWSAQRFMFLPFSSLWGCYVVLIDWRGWWQWLGDGYATTHRVPLAALIRSRRLRRPSPALVALALGSLLIAGGAFVQGARGVMHSYPFACYPTFQWRTGRSMPDLWISVEQGGQTRWLKDSPALGGQRPQPRWGMAWRAAGVYGDEPSRERLIAYYRALPGAVRGPLESGDTVRFYRASLDVTPSCSEHAPSQLELLGSFSGGLEQSAAVFSGGLEHTPAPPE
jgi:uncharacterized membrane protein YphA (DoxX/SURF4 family)